MSHQRRRLALLALLAASGERGLSRDQLIGYLWPESAGDSGRHSLEQLLHSLRRALGDSIFAGTNPLSLNSAAIISDVGDFTHALSSDHLEEAVAQYHGQFLQPQSIFSFDPATAGASTRNVESGYQLQLSLRYSF